MLFFYFFKQKTAYEMRISDWSSDVCSSDLFNADYLEPGDNVATGHAKFDFKDLRPVAPLTWSNVAGAGGIYSSVHDLSKWMRVQLDGGVISGEGADAQRLFSEKRQTEMWSVLTPIPISAPSVPQLAAAQPNFRGYAEGWVLTA